MRFANPILVQRTRNLSETDARKKSYKYILFSAQFSVQNQQVQDYEEHLSRFFKVRKVRVGLT